jgi:hypothetical protein
MEKIAEEKKASTTWRRMLCSRCIMIPADLSFCQVSGSRSTSRSSESRTSPARAQSYKDEAQHVAHDITTKLCALPLDRAVAADSESLDDEPLFPPRDPDEETQ